MFSLAHSTVLALAAVAVSGHSISRFSRHHQVAARFTPPKGWATGYLEPYDTYHERYLDIGCENKHNTTFFDLCCHPMLATETLAKNRNACCAPGATVQCPGSSSLVAAPSSSAAAPKSTSTAASPSTGDDDDDDEDGCDDGDDTGDDADTDPNTGDDDEDDEDDDDAGCEDEEDDEPSSTKAPVSTPTSAKAPASTPTSTGNDDDDDGDLDDCDDEDEGDDEPSSAVSSTPAVTSTHAAASSHAAASTPAAASTHDAAPTSTQDVPKSTSAAPKKTTTPTSTAASSTKTSSSPASGLVTGGFGTWFTQNDVAGACGKVHSDSDFVVALQTKTYANGDNCFRPIRVFNADNGKSVDGIVADECPSCINSESVDMSQGMFEQLADLSVGEFPIKWEFLDN